MSAQDGSWDDLRLVLAVVRGGGLSGAARRLGVNHTTVLRRLDVAEERLGAKLFERTPTGYIATAAGEEMADVAARIEQDVLGLERRLSGRDVGLTGTVRCATVDTIAEYFLPPHLAAFRQAYPGIVVELMVSERIVNLTQRDADVAIRPTGQPPENLVGRRLGTLASAVYGGVGYLDARPDVTDLSDHDWLAFEEGMSGTWISRWIARHYPDARIVMRSNILTVLFAAVKADVGVTVLPCHIAEPEPGLRRLTPLIEDMRTPLWILTHRDTRRSARIRVFMEFMGQRIRAQSGALDCSDAPSRHA
ncbi:MAG: LysR family transcriptional regulator [Sphingomonadales bacterium]